MIRKKTKSRYRLRRSKNLSSAPRKPSNKTLVGVVKRHPDGFGFVIPLDTEHSDVYLPENCMQGVMSNDKVKIAILPRKGRKDLFSGYVVEIIERGFKQVIGCYYPVSTTQGFIKDESLQWGENLQVQLAKGQNIRRGEWVQVSVTHWPSTAPGATKSGGFRGRIVGALGVFPPGLEDNVRVMQKHHIPAVFTSACLKEADQWSDTIPQKALEGRKDLRSLPFVTIDGETAQDFDDAIYVAPLGANTPPTPAKLSDVLASSADVACSEVKNGSTETKQGWALYVAIADVSYYTPPGSLLDQSARLRGNSTYFPHFVSPMLPERLSNDLCSLKAHVDRLAFVAEMHFDHSGKQVARWFYPAVIKSWKRLNYGQAQEIIDQSPLPAKNPVALNVVFASRLAKLLLKNREDNYFINLEIPESEVRLNKLGEPVDIIQSKRLFSHKMIEELMLATNCSVADFLFHKEIPALYRVHDRPKRASLKLLESFVRGLGMKVELTPPDLYQKMSAIIERFSEHTLSDVFYALILKSFSQAVYSADRKHHFGLNFQCYTHFTSPIRRYSDLIVHRMLKAVLAGPKGCLPYSREELESIANIASACEQRSTKAQRHIKDIKKARFLKNYLGKYMEGWICTVTKFGFFVRLRLYDIEGLVHINRLPGKWEFEESLLQLKSARSGQRFEMGDFVQIQVVSSNVEAGQIDFDLKKHQKKFSKKGEVLSKSAKNVKV